jgi:BirA family biotin operon repressor/biotin-[acetyl-CoA-carboxylase] ligase
LGRSFFFYPELDSTNSYAKQMSRVDTLHGALILTDDQRRGRGQYERNWEATPGQNLTFSLVFEPTDRNRLTLLSLACALAVSDVCASQIDCNFCLKWPNDILCDGKKLGGLLTEAIFNGNILDRVIIGIGLNVNQVKFSEELEDIATSLRSVGGQKFSREKLLAVILSKVEYYYRLWSTREIELIRSINKKLLGYGNWTRLNVNGADRDGKFKFLGVNENGQLVVLNKDLEVDTFSYEQVRIHLD